jgi:putative DNA primase/helicase
MKEINLLINQFYPDLESIVNVQDKFYRREESFWFEPIILESEINRIANSLLAQGKPPYLTKAILQNLKLLTMVNPKAVNPPGYFAFQNGVLRWEWQGNQLKSEFLTTEEAKKLDCVFLGKPTFRYEPNADSRALDALLQCLDEPFREILVRTVACALDLPAIRRFKSRIPRALLLYGTGANGKDALRTVLFRLFGTTNCSACSIADFQAYDSGRKFGLADLEVSKLNWSSENAQLKKLDSIESLKLIISGDPISIERKGIQEYRFVPQVVLLFNTNSIPKILAATAAIKTRYAIVPFLKTYTSNPDPAKGELLADPRFKDDYAFIDREILPALFNLLLDRLQTVAVEGIDYSPTVGQLAEARANSSHLTQFVEDVGLIEDSDGIVSVAELWDKLQAWYIDNNFLTIEQGPRGGKRLLWEHPPGERCVTASYQVVQRFTELFPKARRTTIRYTTEDGKDTKRTALLGIRFSSQKSDFQDFQCTANQGKNPDSVEISRLEARTDAGLPEDFQTEPVWKPDGSPNQDRTSKPETPMNTEKVDENAVHWKPWKPDFQVRKGDLVRYVGNVQWIQRMFGTEPAVVVSYVNGCLYLKNPAGGMDVPVLADGWEVCS